MKSTFELTQSASFEAIVFRDQAVIDSVFFKMEDPVESNFIVVFKIGDDEIQMTISSGDNLSPVYGPYDCAGKSISYKTEMNEFVSRYKKIVIEVESHG